LNNIYLKLIISPVFKLTKRFIFIEDFVKKFLVFVFRREINYLKFIIINKFNNSFYFKSD